MCQIQREDDYKYQGDKDLERGGCNLFRDTVREFSWRV
jgi:hypothetical protein